MKNITAVIRGRPQKLDNAGIAHYILPLVALLIVGAVGFKFVSVSHASAPETVCNGSGGCLNRAGGCTSTSGSCHIIQYNNDHDNNEYAALYYMNRCNSNPADEVTQTCPFTVGTGLNSGNAGDYTVQVAFYNTSGNLIGCLGDSGGKGVLTKCNGPTGYGGGTGTLFVLGGNRGLAAGLLDNVRNQNAIANTDAPAVGLRGAGNGNQVTLSTTIASYYPGSVWHGSGF